MQMVFYFFRLKSYEAKNKKEKKKKKCGQFCMDFFLVAKAEP